MDTRVAVLSIIIDRDDAVDAVNDLLHQYRQCIVGRMGIPYRERDLYVICITLDAPMDEINALSGALGRLEGVSAKASLANSR